MRTCNRKSATFGLQIGSFQSRSFPDLWSRERRLSERDCCLRVSGVSVAPKARHSREVRLTFLRVLAHVGSSSPDQASIMVTPNVEREQTDQETPRTVPETQQELVRRLLGEVSKMRKENQKLQSEVATLKANVTKRKLFRQPKKIMILNAL